MLMIKDESSISGMESALAQILHRLLLTTDGTFTELLEAMNKEKLFAVLLKQEIIPAECNIAALDLHAGEPVLNRTVLLRGESSGNTYVYAESSIAVERLDDRIRRGLLTTNVPLGHLWKRNRVEMFKEVLNSRVQGAGDLHSYFDISPETQLLFRSCRISCSGKPVVLLVEYVHCFDVQKCAVSQRNLFSLTRSEQQVIVNARL